MKRIPRKIQKLGERLYHHLFVEWAYYRVHPGRVGILLNDYGCRYQEQVARIIPRDKHCPSESTFVTVSFLVDKALLIQLENQIHHDPLLDRKMASYLMLFDAAVMIHGNLSEVKPQQALMYLDRTKIEAVKLKTNQTQASIMES